MAFFKNSGYDLNEKAGENEMEEAYGSGGNGDEDASSSDESAVKVEDQCRSESEQLNSVKVLENETSEVNGTGRGGRRTALVGKWGSSFWKDCQPMWDSKDVESDCSKSQPVSEGDSSEEYDAQKDSDHAQGAQVDVLVDEMLSDEYYEQDGEDQSDYLPYGEVKRNVMSDASLLPKPVSANKLSRNSKSADCDKYKYDEDYEDEDEEEGNPIGHFQVFSFYNIWQMVFFISFLISFVFLKDGSFSLICSRFITEKWQLYTFFLCFFHRFVTWPFWR